VVGYGAWTKAFLKITKANEWILLSATPGDTWLDYMPVFIANGFYRNKSESMREHVVYKRFVKFPQVERYVNEGRLLRQRNMILVDMDFERPTEAHHIDIVVDYDRDQYREVMRNRWDIWNDEPLMNASAYCQALRRVVNSSETRSEAVLDVIKKHPKVIIFYNYNYELELLRALDYKGIWKEIKVAEWNGHKHMDIPRGDFWVYLVQYTAGAEGWNCTKTDTMIFYSPNYSYKIMQQAAGRIDRLNTPYKDLYYYHLKTKSGIDLGIDRALKTKKRFNESRFATAFKKNIISSGKE
jgi:superfamily II DNA or RNA helicase